MGHDPRQACRHVVDYVDLFHGPLLLDPGFPFFLMLNPKKSLSSKRSFLATDNAFFISFFVVPNPGYLTLTENWDQAYGRP